MNRFTRLPAIDIHQHLWPDSLIAALRRRRSPPCLRGWLLELPGQEPFAVSASDHDVSLRRQALADDGVDIAVLALSSALGIERLPEREAQPLLEAYHEGTLELAPGFRAWASTCLTRIDSAALERNLARGSVGLELPADAMVEAGDYEELAPLLDVLEGTGRPLFIHPGPAAVPRRGPAWWPAVVAYPQQMHAAWHAFQIHGRPRHPRLRVCFALLAGLGPLHAERARSRGGLRVPHDPLTFLEISSYGPRAVDATLRVVGIDALLNGSDRPYAEPVDPGLGPAVDFAIRTANPNRLLELEGVSNELALASTA